MTKSTPVPECRSLLGRSLVVRLCASFVFLGAVATAGAGDASPPRYLAVFVDGRVLPVSGAGAVDELTIRLELPSGGSVELPLERVDRIVEAVVEPDPKPIEPPRCDTDFVADDLPAATPYREEILAASRRANLHPWLVAAVVEAESGYDRWAVSRVGARGLMQLMPSVWVENGVTDPHDVRANLQAGAGHLRRLLDRFGELTFAIAAYNAGAATVERSGGVPPYRETRRFVRRVLASFCPGAAGDEVRKK